MDAELEVEVLGVGVGLDELGVDGADEMGEELGEVAEVEGEELLRLKVGWDPGMRWVEVSGNNASTYPPHPITLENDNNGAPNGT